MPIKKQLVAGYLKVVNESPVHQSTHIIPICYSMLQLPTKHYTIRTALAKCHTLRLACYWFKSYE